MMHICLCRKRGCLSEAKNHVAAENKAAVVQPGAVCFCPLQKICCERARVRRVFKTSVFYLMWCLRF